MTVVSSSARAGLARSRLLAWECACEAATTVACWAYRKACVAQEAAEEAEARADA